MSSTEQKNIVQTFINSSYTFGILPTIATGKFGNYGLDTGRDPFNHIGHISNYDQRLQLATNPLEEARSTLPVLRSARCSARSAPFILALTHGEEVISGNMAVMRFCEGVVRNRWGIHFETTHAIRHARRHAGHICSILAPGGYSQIPRTQRNANKLAYSAENFRYRNAADCIDFINHGIRSGRYNQQVRQWCTLNREKYGFASRYRKDSDAVKAYHEYRRSQPIPGDLPPEIKQKYLRTSKYCHNTVRLYKYGELTFIKIGSRSPEPETRVATRRSKSKSQLFCFTKRDLDDLRFLLQACSQIRSYHQRRVYDFKRGTTSTKGKRLMDVLWTLYLDVMRACGSRYDYRNKLGVYFDVLQWRYLAERSGNEFYNHSDIMAQKVESKGLKDLPDQNYALMCLRDVPMDVAVDMLGMYKASIYPEVDPFKVVCDQLALHRSRFQTDWPTGSLERERFEETRAYMWYFGVRVLYKRYGVWPGRIRQGVEEKVWHKTYKTQGIPGEFWRDGSDVDLTGAVPVMNISNEQYLKQQDAACAPPFPVQYRDFDSMRNAPRHHKRKLLYAIQQEDPPDLRKCVDGLDKLGREIPDYYVGRIEHNLPFSTDIVTGSRCERHKDAPRPFYAASSPWGCILSYYDGITRDFLKDVPQSMLGKSTRQKFVDISTTAKGFTPGTRAFYMSDDKAKYSPRMDPNSQQLPAEFFAEIFNCPGLRAVGPIMYHNQLYYRVCGHLVSYDSNGTDREGMRGASNTWLEIVAQGLATRINREKGRIVGKSTFLSFIDDGLRKFSVVTRDKNEEQIRETTREVIQEVIFGLKVLGRELSWDKTFVSQDLFVILNELMFEGSHISSGLKSFCTAGDIELKEVMAATDYEQLYFGKMRGAHGVGCPLDMCHYAYVYETLISHYKMGLKMQDNNKVSDLEYRLFCVTPVALGGAGIRSMAQMGCNEVANATKEGIGCLYRFGKNADLLSYCVEKIIYQEPEEINAIDFMREPEQFHVSGPRLKSQRLPAEVRRRLYTIVRNETCRSYLDQDREGMSLLREMGEALKASGNVSAEDVRLLYSMTPVAFIDDFVQKLASSATLSSILGSTTIATIRRAVKRDLINAVEYFRVRCCLDELLEAIAGDRDMLLSLAMFM